METKQPIFPTLTADTEQMHSVAEWTEEHLENKINEYWAFLDRTDLQPRAIKAARRMLEHLGFEMDYRFPVANWSEDGIA